MLAIISNVKRMFHQYEKVGMNVTLKRAPGPVSPTKHVLLEERHVALKMYVCTVCIALMTNMVFAPSLWIRMSASVRAVHVVYYYRHLFAKRWYIYVL